ncbi:MAG: RNB domain-containing ribonuclease [Gaiella sp.]|uniref:RNB domain-containing ribonuclease n=1 Tax=Gaiella sp. TaxID=2663207 RepID=UPI003C3AB0C7
MPRQQLRLAGPRPTEIQASLTELRRQMKIPVGYPDEVVADAKRAIAAVELPDADETAIEFLTIDPPESKDLDQALHIERRGSGYRVRYAIADVAAFVAPGSPLDEEAHRRGVTLYAPDGNTRLYPPELSEGAASLLPGELRPALVWTMDVDETGEGTDVHVRKARVRSRKKLDYGGVQHALDDGSADEVLRLLREVGILRQQREARRGGVSLQLPEQEVMTAPDGYELSYRAPFPVEGWNAQISLMTGMAAAELMLEGEVGILRTVPAADPARLERFRHTAKALGVLWPKDTPYPAFVRTLDANVPRQAALLAAAAGVMRGSGYTAFDRHAPSHAEHAALASTYAHTTAPLRRLVDRYVGETCIALSEGRKVPGWVATELPELPDVMELADRRASQYEAGIVSAVEAALLEGSVGKTFEAVVIEVDRDGAAGSVELRDPAVTARCDGPGLPLGETVTVRCTLADVLKRQVRFALA